MFGWLLVRKSRFVYAYGFRKSDMEGEEGEADDLIRKGNMYTGDPAYPQHFLKALLRWFLMVSSIRWCSYVDA